MRRRYAALKSELRKKTNKSKLPEKCLEQRGIQIIEYGGEKANLLWLIRELGKRGITSVLIEGGASLNAYALREGIVDKVIFFIAPKIMGGVKSFPAIGGETYRKLEEMYKVTDLKIRKIGEDILIEGYIERNKKGF